MKTYVLMMIGALALVSCKDEEASLRIESLERRNARLEEANAKLKAELELERKPEVQPVAIRSSSVDPGVSATPDYLTAHMLLSDHVSEGHSLTLGLKTFLAIPSDVRTPEVLDLLQSYRNRITFYRSAKEGIERTVPKVLADPNTNPERLEMMKSQIKMIDESTREIEALALKLPAEK